MASLIKDRAEVDFYAAEFIVTPAFKGEANPVPLEFPKFKFLAMLAQGNTNLPQVDHTVGIWIQKGGTDKLTFLAEKTFLIIFILSHCSLPRRKDAHSK